MRKTSLDAYSTIKNNGYLSTRRWQIYNALFKYGPCTANELFVHIKRENPESISNANIVTRLGELRDMTIVSEIDTRPCEVTKMNVIVWDVTDQLPVKIEKKSTAKETIAYLEGKVLLLEERLKRAEDALLNKNT